MDGSAKRKSFDLPFTLESWIDTYGDDFGFVPTRLAEPTDVFAGTDERVQLMRERAERGRPLFVRGDHVLMPGCERYADDCGGGVEWKGGRTLGAEYSKCGRFRYRLWMRWSDKGQVPVFIGLSPGMGTESEFDLTLSRIQSFCIKEGCAGFEVLNLFAYRCATFDDLIDADDMWGEQNDRSLRIITQRASYVIVHWGVGGYLDDRSARVLWALRKKVPESAFHCFGLTRLRRSSESPTKMVGQPRCIENVSYDAVTIPLPWEQVEFERTTERDVDDDDDGESEEGVGDFSG